ncbi:MAG: hypothetical protein DRJ66_04360 [Thermoprotei archaeon]|nr:MAG: hypothetical protein DRJ66_04360 [Thermoprotei archaeon]
MNKNDFTRILERYFSQSEKLIGGRSHFKVLKIHNESLEAVYSLRFKEKAVNGNLIGSLFADLVIEVIKYNGMALDVIDLTIEKGTVRVRMRLYGILGLRAIDAINFVLVRELYDLINAFHEG